MVHRKYIKPNLLTNLTDRNTTKLISFDEAFSNFLDSCLIKGLSKWTIVGYQKEIKSVRKSLEENNTDLTNLKTLTMEHFEKCISSQLKLGYKANTINTRIRAAKTFFNYCVRKKYLSKSPLDEIANLKVRHVVGDTFTKLQAAELLKEPDISTFTGLRDYTIMMTFLHTGIRLSELAGIQLQDLILSEKSLNIQRAKNRYGRRIPLTKKLCKVLNVYLKVRGHIEMTKSLFVTENEAPLSIRAIQYQIKLYGKKTGVSNQVMVSPHVFRRSFAKNKIQAGVDIFTVMALMGHTDILILKKYIALYSSDLDNAIERGIE